MKRLYIIIIFIAGLYTLVHAESSKEYYDEAAQCIELAKQSEDEIKYFESEISQLQCMRINDNSIQMAIKQKEQHIKNYRQKAQEYRTKAKLLKLKGDQLAKQGK